VTSWPTVRVVMVVLTTALTPASPVTWKDTNALTVRLPSFRMIALNVSFTCLARERWWNDGNALWWTSDACPTCVTMLMVAEAVPVFPELSVTVSVTVKGPVVE